MATREFDIEIYSLNDGAHDYEFDITDQFWSNFDYGLISKGEAHVSVALQKSPTLITLDLRINGKLKLECDRSLEEYDHPFEVQKNLVFKYGHEEGELGEDVYVISPTASVINISQHLYEFIALQVPIKKLHPRFRGEANQDTDELVYRDASESEDKTDTVDPRWESLKNLREDN